MKNNKSRYMLALSMMLLMGLFVISCGSKDVNPTSPTLSSSEEPTSEEPTTGTTSTVSGVAATGAAMTGTVTLKDSNGTVLGPQAIGAGGTFSFDVTGLTPPFYIRAEDTTGTGEVLYSVSMGPGTGNVNPLTNLIVAAAAGVNDPADVYNDPGSHPIDQTALDDAVEDVQDVLAVLLDDYDADNVDPLTDPFTIGEGLDLFFDEVGVDMDTTGGVVTFLDSNNDQLCQTDITALVTGVSYAPVAVDGNGIATSSGTLLATLSLAVSEGDLDGSTLSYQDEAEALTLKDTSITEITLEGNIATIKGTGSLFSTLESGNGYDFIATITDDDPLDSIGIMISTPSATSTVYELTSQPLTSGDFTITLNP
ncbi:MAG TPA: hypothetical protein ENG83_01595 [Nitrospirae bacterium]|nr:hypothetical protein BMS3Abin06_00024 [bacterium BMS3Abin06]HDH10894.1 hypothetical protein [Nitrospirota bacterium]HDY99861.1 hypothetical protein [Nitrospirota bacterium]